MQSFLHKGRDRLDRQTDYLFDVKSGGFAPLVSDFLSYQMLSVSAHTETSDAPTDYQMQCTDWADRCNDELSDYDVINTLKRQMIRRSNIFCTISTIDMEDMTVPILLCSVLAFYAFSLYRTRCKKHRRKRWWVRPWIRRRDTGHHTIIHLYKELLLVSWYR
jgi:hypothetical protein